jgi:hypothetical protein
MVLDSEGASGVAAVCPVTMQLLNATASSSAYAAKAAADLDGTRKGTEGGSYQRALHVGCWPDQANMPVC